MSDLINSYSKFTKTSNRFFCIGGQLDDIFCTEDMQILSFYELLAGHLHNIGFDAAFFYNGAEKKFFCVDESSRTVRNELISKKDSYNEGVPNPHVFFDFIDKGMKDTRYKKAFIVCGLNDFLLHDIADKKEQRDFNNRYEKWLSSYNNDNIVIFLERNLELMMQNSYLSNRAEYGALVNAIYDAREMKINQKSCLSIGAPKDDEIRNLLMYLHIVGHNGRYLFFDMSEEKLERLIRDIVFYSRKNKFDSLKEICDLLCSYMENAAGFVLLDSDILIHEIFHEKEVTDKPLDKINHTTGWEPAAKVIEGIISSYHRKIKASQKREEENNDESVNDFNLGRCRVDRFEGMIRSANNYRIPSIVLQGPPGVGKTEIAKLIGRIFQEEGILRSGHTVRARRDDLVSDHVGGTAIKTNARIMEAQEGVLLIDEVYSLAEGSPSSNSAGFAAEAINTLVAAMTEKDNRMCVIFSGYKNRMDEVWKMNEGLASRFSDSNIITLDGYDQEVLMKIFVDSLKEFEPPLALLSPEVKNKNEKLYAGRTSIESADLKTFFDNYYNDRDRESFGNARDVKNLVESIYRSAVLKAGDDEDKIWISREDFGERSTFFIKRGLDEDDIFKSLKNKYCGMDWLKELLLEIKDIKFEYEIKGQPYPGPMHMIWVGKPGSGKSTAAKMLANYYHYLGIFGAAEPIYVDASELLGQYIGESQRLINERIDDAVRKNAVLIIEEAYQLSAGGEKSNPYGKAAINAIMNRMEDDRDKFNLIFVVYESEYENFLKSNPGLISRIKKVTIHDYSIDQLISIFRIMAEDSKDTVTDEVVMRVRDLLDGIASYDDDGHRFVDGNARTVRKILDHMRAKRSKRFRDSNRGQSIAGLQNAELDWSFIADDVPDISDAKSFVNINQ